MARFSRRSVLEDIVRRYVHQAMTYERAAGKVLDPGNGYAQCRGLSTEAQVAYGAWRALLDLARDIEAGDVA